MISVSSSYNAITSTSGSAYEWQVINGANTYGKDKIVTGTIKTAVYEKLSIGNTIAAELNLTLRGVSGISTSDPLEVQFRAVAGVLTSSWYTKGIFYIDTIESSPYSEIVQITAFDAMLKSEVDFMPTGSYVPMTTAQVYSQIVTDMGVSSHSATNTWLTNNPVTLSNAPNVGVGGTTDRDMLSYLGIMYVGNWVISPQNELKLVFADLAAANTVTVGDAVQSMDASPSDTVERVKLWLDSNTYYLAPTGITEAQWLALGGICIEAHLPFYATQALASTIYNAFRLKTYYPYTATGAYIDPKYEVGDGISLDATNPFSSFIASQTLTMDGISPSDVEFKGEEKVNSLYPYVSSVQRDTIYQVSKAQDTADAAQTAASNAQSSANNANYREQIIYRSAVSGTNTMAANTTWVTDATGGQNKWTTVRPVYDSSYPVLFVATQRQSVSQSSGTTCTCTTPAKDQTTTVIDGGHITTGTIDASVVTVSNLNASNITSGTINAIDITGSNITGSTLTSSTANGSVRIKDGSIDFFPNASTIGTPFSQIQHTVDSVQGDSIEWTNSGYTKLVNTGGGQWTADFLNFKINSDMQMQIYPDSDGFHTKIMSDFVQMTGDLTVGGDLTVTGTTTPSGGMQVGNFWHPNAGNSQYQSAANTSFASTAAHTWEQVTDLSISAPTNGLYAIYAQAAYNNGSPEGIAIVTRGSSSSYRDYLAITDRTTSGLTAGTTQYLKTSGVVPLNTGDVAIVYVKYSGASSNNIQLKMYLL